MRLPPKDAVTIRPDVPGAVALDDPGPRLSAGTGIAPAVGAVGSGTREDLFELADRLAGLLDEEADLRGVIR
jgi:hypothetical protein